MAVIYNKITQDISSKVANRQVSELLSFWETAQHGEELPKLSSFTKEKLFLIWTRLMVLRRNGEDFTYEHYLLAYFNVCENASDVNKERIMRDRETIGLLRTLAFAVDLFIVFLIAALIGAPAALVGLYLAGIATAVVVLVALHFSYRFRNRTLVRDVLLTFIAT